ncbi:hypothetical protein Cgig2_011909 [Carnegiea gigantea]|uniref:VTT domain-containing protein n=1 Tax=Carnegiea gigantea TaxID=171969 RepID=A0A9Q1K3S2_9CARY|nr:hypothetical protein Cgig2_011909 [Carnegiea gigantea]
MLDWLNKILTNLIWVHEGSILFQLEVRTSWKESKGSGRSWKVKRARSIYKKPEGVGGGAWKMKLQAEKSRCMAFDDDIVLISSNDASSSDIEMEAGVKELERVGKSIRSFQSENAAGSDSASSNDRLLGGVEVNEGLFTDQTDGFSGKGGSFLAKLAIAVGVAATITLVSIGLKQQTPDSSLGIRIQCLADGSSSSSIAASPAGFTFNAFGYKVVLPEYTPGWVYFWLLMAAGCGFFISEEALNIWVGITLARRLCLDGTWQSLAESFSKNAPYIISTVLWVYWGVCISDMVPFYLGKLFRQTGASEDLCSKLGIGKEKLMNITRAVQRYGNLSGFVERFSIGMRNPTAFLAGAVGVPPDCFFAGVCIGGLITLPIQLAIGFLLRERPMFAVASVATVVKGRNAYISEEHWTGVHPEIQSPRLNYSWYFRPGCTSKSYLLSLSRLKVVCRVGLIYSLPIVNSDNAGHNYVPFTGQFNKCPPFFLGELGNGLNVLENVDTL